MEPMDAAQDFNTHFPTCKQRGSCAKCKFILKNYGYHAKTCTDIKCQKPFCFVMKQKLTMLKCVHHKRKYAVELLLQTISSDRNIDPARKARDKASYAKKAEHYTCLRSFTQSDYYRLLAVQKWDIEMAIEEREEERILSGRQSVAIQTDDAQVVPIIPDTN